MRHNGRAPLKASEMPPGQINLRENEPIQVRCPDCKSRCFLERSMIKAHRDGQPVQKGTRRYLGDEPASGRRCHGSGQRIIIDITPEEWAERQLEADSDVASRRSSNPMRKPSTRPAPAPGQMTAATASLRERLNEHLQSNCVHCRVGRCGRAIELRQRIRRAAEIAMAPTLISYSQLRTGFREHRVSCAQCRKGAPCAVGRKFSERLTSIVHKHIAHCS